MIIREMASPGLRFEQMCKAFGQYGVELDADVGLLYHSSVNQVKPMWALVRSVNGRQLNCTIFSTGENEWISYPVIRMMCRRLEIDVLECFGLERVLNQPL